MGLSGSGEEEIEVKRKERSVRDEDCLFSEVLLTTCPCRSIPLHGESTTIVDPRLRIHSARLRAKVRQLILDRLPSDCLDRNEILEELDHLVESPGRRLYWYRVICFLQNISNANNSSKQVHSLLKELSRLLVLTPTLSKILKIKQKYPKAIPIESTSTMNKDPRQEISHRAKSVLHLKLLRYH